MPNWFLPQLIEQIQAVLTDAGFELSVSTELPQGQTAWIAVPVFGLAKQQGRSLPDVAEEIAQTLSAIDDVDVTAAGGFVNITPTNLRPALVESSDLAYGASDVGHGQMVIVEFPGINVAKPMGIGHLRSTIIGDSLARILTTQGYQVQTHNYLGDWGTQFGKVLVAYEREFGSLKPRDSITIELLQRLYVGFHEEEQRDSTLSDDAQAMFKRLEAGDSEVRTLWEYLVRVSLAEMHAIFQRLGGIHLDYPEDGEAFYEPYLGAVIEAAQAHGKAMESDGALIVRVPGEETPLMLQKSNGTTTYATRDLAQVRYRVSTFHPSKILYCVANEQSLHFRQYFAAARSFGFVPPDVELTHVKFGLLRLPQGKMSTRRGTTVLLDAVLDEAVRRARAVVEAKSPDLADAKKDQIAQVVGIGALKYFDLSHDRNHDIVFDWDRMLSLAGDSAPYLQYAYVRAKKILAKSSGESVGDTPPWRGEGDAIVVPVDIQALIRTLAQYPLMIERAAAQYAPHIIATYLNSLATEFSSFYENYPVLQSEGTNRALRLAIVAGVATVLKSGLNLLGIDVVDEM